MTFLIILAFFIFIPICWVGSLISSIAVYRWGSCLSTRILIPILLLTAIGIAILLFFVFFWSREFWILLIFSFLTPFILVGLLIAGYQICRGSMTIHERIFGWTLWLCGAIALIVLAAVDVSIVLSHVSSVCGGYNIRNTHKCTVHTIPHTPNFVVLTVLSSVWCNCPFE